MENENKLKVYCETTFWSYLVGRQTADEKIARDQAYSLKWWQEIAPKCDIYISQHVTIEALLLSAHAVPDTEPTDALHIATASIYAMDVLLTLNCKHMANPVSLPKTISTITKAGYECPIIITPVDFMDRREEFGL